MYFVIANDNNVTACETRQAAREAEESGGVFSTREQLIDLLGGNGKRFVELWNSLPGVTPVKKFTSIAVAAKRIVARLQELFPDQAKKIETADDMERHVNVSASIGAPVATAALAAKTSSKKASKTKGAPKTPKAAKEPRPKTVKDPKTPNEPKGESKQDQVVALLKRKNGATITEIMDKMGWLRHTVRGFMAGAMKKAGYDVESFKPEGGERSYRING